MTATDNCNNSTTLSQTITVVDTTAPELTIPADVTVQCDAVPAPGEASATDNCDADVTVSYIDEKREDGDCADSYFLFRVWQATDNCGNTTLKTQQITVIDTVAPVISGVDADYTVECPDAPLFSNPTASDTCDADVDLQYNDVEDLDDCGLGTITRTWTATDNCGNSSQASQTITIQDTVAPEIKDVGADMKIECPEQPVFSEPTVIEDCDKEYSFGYTDKDDRDECGLGSITRTWTATDCAGNSSSASQTITIEDNVAPEIIGVGDDMTIDCPAQPEFSQPYASDACDQEPMLDYVDSSNLDDCGLGTVTRTWTATDCKGNSSTASQTITIQDITDPVLTVPADETVQCDAIPDLGVATATDTCDNDVHVKFVEERTEPGDCENSYTLFRIWLATDCAGNSVLGTQEITVVDTTAPVFAGVGADDKIECPAQPVFSEPTASDNCDADVTITFVDKDDRDECGLGNVTRTWTATDNCGNSSEASQTITVEDNVAPEIIGVGDDYTVECPDSPVFSEPTVKDDCDGSPDLRYEDTPNLDDCGLGTITRTWYATDCKGNMSSDSQTITIDDTVAPEITDVQADYTVECPDALVWSEPTVKDDCDQQPKLEYNDDYNLDDCGLGTVTRTWTATDCKGNQSTDSQTITIEDNTAPVISGVGADEIIECPELPKFSKPTATDTCDSAPSLTFEDKDDRDDCGLGSITRTWTATDCAGNSSTASQTITVEDNVAPTIEGVEDDFTVECPEEWKFSEPTAFDDCSDTGFNEEDWTVYEGYDGKVVITPNKITIKGGDDGSGYPDDAHAVTTCPVNGVYSFKWNYSTEDDPYYDFAYVVNGVPYYLSDLYGNQQQSGWLTLNCQAGDVIGWGVYSRDSQFGKATLKITHYNAPGSGVSLTYEDVEDLDDCGLGTITRTWTAKDCAGNSSTASQTVTIKDTVAPVISGVEADYSVECPDGPVFSEPTAKDDCDAQPKLDFNDVENLDDCGLGTVTRTWTATDCAGNSSTASQTITIYDETDPYFNEALPQDVSEECDKITPAAILTASDACDTDVKVEFTEVKTDGDCPGEYTLTRTWTAADCAGNDIEHVQIVTVFDETAPEEGEGFILPPSISDINGCQDDYLAPPMTEEEFALMFTDNCSNVVVTLFSSPVGNNCGWSIIHIYTVADDCGNVLGDYKVYYSGEDLTAPDLVGLPADTTIECTDDIPLVAPVSAIDTCDDDVQVEFNESTVNYDCAGNYDILRTWTAMDDCYNTVSHTQTIQVRDNEAPVLIGVLPEGSNENNMCAPDTDNELAALGVLTEAEFAALYNDSCSGVNVTRKINLNGDDCKWIMDVLYTITDDCGNEAQPVKVWYHGADMTAPEPSGECENETMEIYTSQYGVCPADATFVYDDEITASSGQVSIGGLTFDHSNLKPCFTDNCATQDELTFVVTGTDESDPNTCSRIVTITFDVLDNCENAYKGFVCTFVIIDDVNPTFDSYVDEVIFVECGDDLPSFDVKASDNCDANVDIDYSESACPQASHEHGTNQLGQGCAVDCIMRTWTATDDCGNTATQVQYAVIIDTTPPVIDCAGGDFNNPVDLGYIEDLPYDTYNDLFNYVVDNILVPTATDNCVDPYLGGFLYLYYGGQDNNNRPIFYFEADYYAVDACGNYTDYCYAVWTATGAETPPTYSPVMGGICNMKFDLETGEVLEQTSCSNQAQAEDASQDLGVELDFTAYPVPFDRDVNVKFNFEFDTDVTIEIHDTKGLLVKSLTLNNVRAGSDVKKSFDLSRAGDQLFYITVTTNQGSVTKKVVSSNMKIRR